MIKFQSGQGVCGSVGGPFDGISLVNWAMKSRWCICCGDCWSGAAGEGKGQWLVVPGNVKMCTFNEMLKMLDCLVDCQELTIKSAVVLGWGQLPGEVDYWTDPMSCCSTALIATSEASVRMQVGKWGWGWWWKRREALSKASLIDLKAARLLCCLSTAEVHPS